MNKRLLQICLTALLCFIAVLPAYSQTDGIQLTPTDPNVNQINWAASLQGSTISGCPTNSGSWPLSNLIDSLGSENAYWSSCTISAGESKVIDLGVSRTFRSIYLRLYDADPRFFNYKIESSPDGIEYELIVDRTTGEHRSRQVLDVGEVTARFVKITGTYSSLNDSFHLIDEIHVIGTEPTTPEPTQQVEIDAKLNSGGSYANGKVVNLNAGIYKITYLSGALSKWGSDAANGGKTWEGRTDVTVPHFNKHYQFGFVHDRLSRYATAEEAQSSNQDRFITLYLPAQSDVYLWFADDGPTDNRGSSVLEIKQLSGPNDSLLTRVRDAMTRSVLWQQTAVANWQQWIANPVTRECFGCHIQTQAMVGLHSSKDKLPDLPVSQELIDDAGLAFIQWLNAEGNVPQSGHPVTNTSLWSWAVASQPDHLIDSSMPYLLNALNWLNSKQQANGGWNADHGSASLYTDGTPSATHTTGNIQAYRRVIEELGGAEFEPFANVQIDGNQVTLGQNYGTINDIKFTPVQDITGIRIRITQTFHGTNFVITEFDGFDGDTELAVISGQANFQQNGYPFTESFNGVNNDISDGWAYSPQNVTVTPALGLWRFGEPVDLSRIRLTQVYPNAQVKQFSLDVTYDPNPTLSSFFIPVEVQEVGNFVDAPGSVVDESKMRLRKAADLYLGASWSYTANIRRAAQTVIGLHSALPYLTPEKASAALLKLTEVGDYIRSKQKADGSWSDSGALTGEPWTIPTAQALYALLLLSPGDIDLAILKGARFLLEHQDSDGSWKPVGGVATSLASTTWVEIALPILFDILSQTFALDKINDLLAFGLQGEVELGWTPIPDATGYNIYRSSAGTPWSKIATNVQTNIASYTDTQVANEITYYYKVRWLNNQGVESADSNEASATPYGMVCGGDSPPIITSAPPTGAVQDNQYIYQVEASDPDPNDELTYSLLIAPAGMSIDSQTGLITFTPTAAQAGTHQVRIIVEDQIGRFATQAYQLAVAAIFFNYPPQFVTTPPGQGYAGEELVYNSKALDPNATDYLTYTLLAAPSGATINSSTGRVRWTPGFDLVGEFGSFSIRATDAGGLFDEQSYSVQVLGNLPPQITSNPTTVTPRLQLYLYDVEASDPENATLAYSLLVKPQGMSIQSSTGLISWNPTQAQVGEHQVKVKVADPSGQEAIQEYTLAVVDNDPPYFASTPILIAVAALNYSYSAFAVDPENTTVQYEVVSAPAGLTINPNSGVVSWLPTTADVTQHFVKLKATDAAGLVGYQQYNLEVLPEGSDPGTPPGGDPGVGGPPSGGSFAGLTVTIHTPPPGATIEQPTDVSATITTTTGPPDSWQATLWADNSNFGFPIGSGTGEVINSVIGKIDPTLLANDSYKLYIQVTKGALTGTLWFPYDVTSYLKLGEFALTSSDLSIPLSGLSLDIQRHYTTLDRSKGEFGAGWRLKVPGRVVDSANESFGEPFTGSTRVYVTRPDGKRVGFTFTPYKLGFLLPFWIPSFTADPGVTDVLEVDQTVLFNSGGTFWEIFNEYNPSRYYLTTREKVRYTIDEQQGLLEARDANFNKLTFSNGFIAHSSGATLNIERDGANRITKITDLNGKAIEYVYDGAGDLVSVTNQSGETTTYTYTEPHLLKTITLNNGVTILENVYSPDGRLIKQVDGEGNEINIGINVDELTETVQDRNGNITVYQYDENGNLIKRVEPTGAIWEYGYDANFNLVLEKDPLGASISRIYDAASNLLTETNALGQTISFTYNQWGQVLSETDPLGRTATKVYDSNGNLLSETDFAGATRTSSYDIYGNLLSSTGPTGELTSFSYNSLGRVTQLQNGAGATTSFEYDSNGNLTNQNTTRTDSTGAVYNVVTAIEFDEQNRPVQITDGTGAVTSTEYNEYGEPAKVVDCQNNNKIFEYDSAGRRVKTTYPDGSTELQEFDGEGNLVKSTDRVGRVTQYQYDASNRQIKIINPDGSQSSTSYDLAGRIISETNTRGFTTSYEYDAAGRKIKEVDALSGVTTYSYDAAGREIAVTDALGRTTGYEYDGEGRRTKVINPDGTTIVMVYDGEGRELERLDELGNKTQYAYDSVGRLVSVTDASGATTSYEYDEVGNKLRQIDALGRATKYEYDNARRVTKYTLPLGQSELSSYDCKGNRLTRTDPNGATTQYSYDFDRRLLQTTYPDASTVVYTYFADGNRNTVTDTRGVTSYGYNSRGWLSSVDSPEGLIEYGYDTEGNRTQVSTPGGVSDYTYDALDRMQSVSDSDLGLTQYSYDAVGNQVLVTYPSGASTEHEYNSRDFPVRVTTTDGASQVVQQYEYTLDPVGNRLSILELGGRVSSYIYDQLYRITDEQIVDGGLVASSEFVYDSVGNRLSEVKDGVLTQYSYDANDRVLSAGGVAYSYDANGNTVASDDTSYTWDFEDRLIALSKPGVNAEYHYDPDGLKVSRVLNGELSKQLVDHNQSYSQVLEERDSGDNLRARYLYGRDLLAQSQAGTSSYFHQDALGSTRALSSSSGAITDSYTYRAFGEMLEQSGSTPNKYLFTGEQFAAEADSYYLRARWLTPGVGRLLSSDKFQFDESYTRELNRYVYVANSPVGLIDPSGELALVGYQGPLKNASKSAPSVLNTGLAVACRLLEVARVFRDLEMLRSGEESEDSLLELADWLPQCRIKFPASWAKGWYKKRVIYEGARRHIFYYFRTRKAAQEAANRSKPGPWRKRGKVKGAEAHGSSPGFKPHYHDNHHNDKSKPNIHYMFPWSEF